MTLYRTVLFLVLIVTNVLTFAQNSDDSVTYKVINDSIESFVPAKYHSPEFTNKQYQEILEKTNQQLSLWWNPYGVMIASLGILFTIGTIVAAFLIFNQSRENRSLIKESIDKYENELSRLVEAKNNQIEYFMQMIEKDINEYKSKLESTSTNDKAIEQIIKKLESQRQVLQLDLNTVKHAGWHHKDIAVNIDLDVNTFFSCYVTLNSVGQDFVVYLQVVTDDGKKRWIGFAGNRKGVGVNNSNEYTTITNYTSKKIDINTYVINQFKEGYPEIDSSPVKVDCVRLRASDEDKNEITFAYSFS